MKEEEEENRRLCDEESSLSSCCIVKKKNRSDHRSTESESEERVYADKKLPQLDSMVDLAVVGGLQEELIF